MLALLIRSRAEIARDVYRHPQPWDHAAGKGRGWRASCRHLGGCGRPASQRMTRVEMPGESAEGVSRWIRSGGMAGGVLLAGKRGRHELPVQAAALARRARGGALAL